MFFQSPFLTFYTPKFLLLHSISHIHQCHYLYSILQRAAGEDGVLQPGELEKLCKKSPTLLRHLISDISNTGLTRLARKQCHINGKNTKLRKLSDPAKQMLSQVIG